MGHYAAACEDGTRVWTDDAGWAHFASDPRIVITPNSLFVKSRSGAFGHRAIIKGGDGAAYLIERALSKVTWLGPTVGNYCVGLLRDGTPVWQQSQTKYRVGAAELPIPPAYIPTSQGFYIDGATDQIVWYDEQHRHPVTVGGQELGLASTDGRWTCGQAKDGTYDYLAWDSLTRRLYRAGGTANSAIAPSIATQRDGSAILSRSVPIGWTPSNQFTLYTPPAVIIPTFEPTAQKIGIGIFDDPAGPARIIDISETVTPNVRAVFWEIGTNGRSQSLALARSLNVGALAYKDDHGLRPLQVPTGYRALVFAYPDPNRDIAWSLGRLNDTLQALHAAQIPCDIDLGTYCMWDGTVYDIPEQKALDWMGNVWRLVVHGVENLGGPYPIGAIWCYTRRKPIAGPVVLDGLEHWPNLQTAVDRMKAASGDWQHFPPFGEAPPAEPFLPPFGSLF